MYTHSIIIYHFPKQEAIQEYLDTHLLTRCNSPDWKVHETVAKFFAEKAKTELQVTIDLNHLQRDSKISIPMSSYFRCLVIKNIVSVLLECASISIHY